MSMKQQLGSLDHEIKAKLSKKGEQHDLEIIDKGKVDISAVQTLVERLDRIESIIHEKVTSFYSGDESFS